MMAGHKRHVFTDTEIREMWCAWGGSFHGPNVEHATMPETNFLKLMQAILSGARLVPTHEGETPVPSTHAAELSPSVSANRRGGPSAASDKEAT